MSTKICKTCGNEKALEKFSWHRPGYLKLSCKVCVNIAQNDRRAGKSRKEESAKRHAKFGEQIKHQKRQHRKNNPTLYRNYELKSAYGITLQEKQQIEVKQNGLCAICQKPGKLVVDHCHRTGKVRGLLHGSCNSALGLFKEDPEALVRAASYVITKGTI